MPFTFSHPAIVLPLAYLPKHWFSMTGLIIGSLTPDFEYFFRMRLKSEFSHTIDGLFWFDLPLGIILAFIFHTLVRDSLINNLPTFLKSRFSPITQFNWNQYFMKNWFVVSISVIIGAASHLLWDSFTHDHGYFVEVFPVLTESVNFLKKQVSILKILQHASTLIGGFVVAFVIYKLPINKIEKGSVRFSDWILVVGITLIIIELRI